MKKLLNLSLLVVGMSLAANIIAADSDDSSNNSTRKGGDATGHTFFWVRPQFQDPMPEKISLWRNDRAMARDCGWNGAFQVVPFGGRTTKKSANGLARYFMFGNKTELIVAGATATDVNTDQGVGVDVGAFNFNIETLNPTVFSQPFKSTLSFSPRQSTVGAGFDYIQYFGWNDCCERKWWGEISFPVVRVRNDMRLTETVITPAGTLVTGAAANMTQAFTGQFPFVNTINGASVASPVWQYGKIDGRRSKTGVADVEIKIGYDYVRNDCSYLYTYVGVLAPTGTKPKAEYVFEPIIGENRHVGVLTGGSGGFQIWSGCEKTLMLDVDMAFRYLIRNTQLRSFDLYNRPWSRYMPVFANPAAAALIELSAGINQFTQKLRVHPGFQFSVNSALVYNSECGLEAEVGYGAWGRQGERVRLASPWVVGPAIANTSPFAVADTINRASLIGASFGGAAVDILTPPAGTTTNSLLIQETDLNLGSAACPAALTQTIYGTVGYNWNWCWPIFVGVGGSYEFSRINTAVNRWTVWGKFGVSI